MLREDLESYLRAKGVEARILTFDSHTMTVEDAEKQLGVDKERIIKSLLFIDENGEPILGIVTGDRRIDIKKLRKACGSRRLRLAPPQVVKDLTGYEVGAMPPIGHKILIKTFIDPKVMRFERVYGGGGAVNAMLEIDPRDIKRINEAVVVDISKAQASPE
jgi:Cys-tRNA(Pro) deacylase